MFKSIGCGVALCLLAGCASWFDDRPVPSAAVSTARTAPSRALDAEMRSRLELMRRQPDLASEELIRELEAFLRERERERARIARPPVAPVPAPSGEAVAARPAPKPAVAAAAVPAAPATPPAAAAAVAVVRPAPVREAPVAVQPRASAGSLAEAEALFTRARLLEGERQVARAVPLYADASRQGLVAASVRLMELYTSGADGVARNYVAAVRFKDLALQQGAKLEYQHNKR